MSLLLLPYSSSSLYPALYISFLRKIHCFSTAYQYDEFNFNRLWYGYHKTSVYRELLSYSCQTISPVFPFCATPQISSLATRSISHHLQTLYCFVSNSFFKRTVYPFLMFFNAFYFHLLFIPRDKTHTGNRALSDDVLTLWNSLPEHGNSSNSIISLRHHRKSIHLFIIIIIIFIITIIINYHRHQQSNI